MKSGNDRAVPEMTPLVVTEIDLMNLMLLYLSEA
jgi:hypothetical protein